MKIIKQKTLKDCSICSIAMLLEKPYSEISRDVKSYHALMHDTKFDGCTLDVEKAVLWKHGALFEIHAHNTVMEFRKNYWVAVNEKRINFKKILKGRRGVMSVPSLNFDGYGHSIFWDGKKLYDPSNLKVYTADMAFKRVYQALVLV